MKNFFFCLLACMSLMMIGCSDDPCKDVSCGDGVCNTETGACDCNEGYSGDECQTAIRDVFIGTWNSIDFSCDNDPEEALTLIIVAGDNILDVRVSDPTEPDLEVVSTVTNSTFTIAPQVVMVDGLDVTISGGGTLVDGVMSLNILQEVPGFGDIACAGTFTK